VSATRRACHSSAGSGSRSSGAVAERAGAAPARLDGALHHRQLHQAADEPLGFPRGGVDPRQRRARLRDELGR
jgi:hypothetical protein